MGIDRCPFLVSCSTKSKEKRREESPEAEAPAARRLKAVLVNNLSLNNLPDYLLIQILVRLPTAESIFNSKLVCKRWCSLTSTRYFITNFITHHINITGTAYHHPPSLFLTKHEDPRIFFFDDSPLDFSLEFLPEERNTVSIFASCNDLLFCVARSKQDYDAANPNYYISNPFTKQWFLLPPPPKRKNFLITSPFCFFGLVCEPNYQRWAVQGQQQQQQYESRYRLLRFTWIPELDGVIDIYSSETGLWNEFLLSGKSYRRASDNVVAYDGKLYWFTGYNVACYDPFNNGEIIFFDSPEFSSPLTDDAFPLNVPRVSVYLGVCQGALRLMRLATYMARSSANHVSVWEIDYETRRLYLTQKIYSNNMFCKEEPELLYLISPSRRTPRAVALHPDDKDVVYLGSWDVIVSCKIQNGESDLVGFLPYEGVHQTGQEVFPISLPWWPTPVSMRPQTGHLF